MVLQSNGLMLNGAGLTAPVTAISTSGRVGSAILMAKAKKGVSKTVTVLLEKDADGLGAAGELVEVKQAYAENFLISKGVAVLASKEVIAQKRVEAEAAMEAAIAARKAADKAKETLSAKYGKAGLKYEVQVKNGAIENAVTSDSIAKELERAGVSVPAASIAMPDITELGSVIAEVMLHPEVTTMLKVEVIKSKITISYS